MLADFTENKKAQGICTPRLHQFYSEMVSSYIPCQLCGEHKSFFHSWKKLDLEDTTKPPLLKSCHARSYTSDFVKQEGRCIVPSVGMRSPILSTNIHSHIAALTEGSRMLSLPCRPCSICTTPFSNLARRFVNLVYLMPYASLQQCLQTLFPATVNRTDATDPEQSLCHLSLILSGLHA